MKNAHPEPAPLHPSRPDAVNDDESARVNLEQHADRPTPGLARRRAGSSEEQSAARDLPGYYLG